MMYHLSMCEMNRDPGQCNFELETAIGGLRRPVRNLTELISSGENSREEMYVVKQNHLISRHTACVKVSWLSNLLLDGSRGGQNISYIESDLNKGRPYRPNRLFF